MSFTLAPMSGVGGAASGDGDDANQRQGPGTLSDQELHQSNDETTSTDASGTDASGTDQRRIKYVLIMLTPVTD